jgi:hypothetical protein
MSDEERERRSSGLKGAVTDRDPGDWVDEQLTDIKAKGGAIAAGSGSAGSGSG